MSGVAACGKHPFPLRNINAALRVYATEKALDLNLLARYTSAALAGVGSWHQFVAVNLGSGLFD